MDSLEPIINILVVLAVLSMASERITNILKMGRADLRVRTRDEQQERARVQKIQSRSFMTGIFLALVAKADIFSMLVHIDDPWRTLGWVRVTGAQWFQSPALASPGTILFTIGGCILTGTALGFGSKFWHDVLGAVYELRSLARNKSSTYDRLAPAAQAGGTEDGGDGAGS